jgi:uncharacterized protein (TIGR03437 family)
VPTDVLAFTTDPSAPGASLTQQLHIRNAGGLPLTITSVNCRTNWCTEGTFPTTVNGGTIATVNITVTPGSLAPGPHRTNVEVQSSAGNNFTPVTLLVLQKPAMRLPATGAVFTMPAGGAPALPVASFTIGATGGTFSWTATASSSAGWLSVTTPSGSASPTQSGTVGYSINTSAAGLAAGAYYGAIKIASSGASNSPLEFRVILNVTQPTDPLRPQVAPAGLVFTTSAANATGSVSVLAPSATPVAWQAAAQTTSGGSWLSVSPGTGSATASAPGATTVTANPTGLAPGIYQGAVSYAFAGTGIGSVNVTLVVPKASGAATATVREPAPAVNASCTPSAIAIAQTGLVRNFSAPAVWPVPLAVSLVDDCGNPVANGTVAATFTNGDPPLSLPLADSARGLYAATWTPAHASSQVTINTTATVSGFANATATLVGEVVQNQQPSLNAYAVLNVFDPEVGAALAPGTVVALYGDSLASAVTQPTKLPLPTAGNGTQVFIGGIAAPLYYSSASQINAQIPFELDPALQYQVVVSVNGALTTPQPILMEAANPGIAENSDGTILAEHVADGSLISPASPAKPNEYIEAFAAGMGATTVNVPSGSGAPANPLAYTSPPPTATFDGVSIPIQYAGLVAGTAGLYQLNILIPAGTADGNHTLAIYQLAGAESSNSTLVPVHN